MLLEVKGCTLVLNNIAKFPDAPTIRGKKHVEELTRALDDNYKSTVLFLILREDALELVPNSHMDPNFSEALELAYEQGVHILAYSIKITYNENSLYIMPFKMINVKIPG